MSSVTPIRPSGDAGHRGVSPSFDIRNSINAHLAQAKAIVDLVYICHVEDALEKLDDHTLGWALSVATEQLGAAEDAVGKLYELACGQQEEGQPA